MAESEVILTEDGRKKLEAELEELRQVRRKEVADKIREALSFGDAWENPEYETAKREQAFVEGRIRTLEFLLRNGRVVAKGTAPDIITVGSRVHLRDVETGEILEYTIVGAGEADPLANRISCHAPVAKAILGKKPGERVSVRAPAGAILYEILAINPPEAQVS
ncbi:MAG: transcription elongation factor GreA [Firmicutes bacterium]|nr:transcription elongation factor GreA [Bacillota bacterium]